MRPRPKTAYQRKMWLCHKTLSHHIFIWVHMFWRVTYVLTRCHVTDINHVLTPSHVTEINYVDRGVAARTPLKFYATTTKNCLPRENVLAFYSNSGPSGPVSKISPPLRAETLLLSCTLRAWGRATLDRYHHFHGHSGMCAWLAS